MNAFRPGRACVVAVLMAVAVLVAAPAADAARSGRISYTPVRGSTAVRGPVTALGSGNLTYHGGKVMKNKSVAYAIFWEPAHLQTGAGTSVSATYNSLLARYFGDVGNTGFYNVNTQYFQMSGGLTQFIRNAASRGGTWVDTAPYPASGCVDSATPGNCLTDTQIRAEVAHAIAVNDWTVSGTHAFFVFTSKGEGSCFGSSCAFTDYCGYHSYYRSGGKKVIYANMPYTGTKLGSCGAPKTPNGDIDADSTINVTSHEQVEQVTDPYLDAWYDAAGYENADKCAWDFGSVSLNGNTANQNLHGHYYIMQRAWSNASSSCVLSM